MTTLPLDTNYIFDTQPLFPDWALSDEIPQFTAQDRESIARSHDDFRNGRTLTIKQAEHQSAAVLERIYSAL